LLGPITSLPLSQQLYLVYRADQMAFLRLLIATWLDLAIIETLGLDEPPARRIFKGRHRPLACHLCWKIIQ
jgi:hypothetical protein